MLIQKSPTLHVFNDDVVCNLNVFSCSSVHAMYRVKVGNDQEMAHSERNSHSQNRSVDNQALILREQHIVSRVSSYFPIGGY